MKYLNLLTLALAILKLTGAIAWPWLVIFIPTFIFIGSLVLALVLVAILFKTAGNEILKAIQNELDSWPNS